jgi:hypothetical protein
MPLELEKLIWEAAETLDDAHENWLEQRLHSLRYLRYG